MKFLCSGKHTGAVLGITSNVGKASKFATFSRERNFLPSSCMEISFTFSAYGSKIGNSNDKLFQFYDGLLENNVRNETKKVQLDRIANELEDCKKCLFNVS